MLKFSSHYFYTDLEIAQRALPPGQGPGGRAAARTNNKLQKYIFKIPHLYIN